MKEYPFKLIDVVKDNKVFFRRYRQNYLYYSLQFHLRNGPGLENINLYLYEFPVPIEDIGEATFNLQEKAITLMRYIRKAMDEGTLVPVTTLTD